MLAMRSAADLAEHLDSRSRDELLPMIDAAGARVLGWIRLGLSHPKVSDASDSLHAARAAKVTSLWRPAVA